MIFSYGAWLVVLGVLGAANFIIAKVPSAKDLIGRLAPYQGWMGVASASGRSSSRSPRWA